MLASPKAGLFPTMNTIDAIDPMKLLLIHPHDIHSPLEPWTVRIVSFAREYARLGHQVRLVHFPRLDVTTQDPVELPGVEVHGLSRKNDVVTLFKNTFIIGRLSAGVDVIHFQKCFHWVSIPALIAGYLGGKRLHYDWDDWEEKIYIASHQKPQHFVVWFLRTFERWLPCLADTVSVSSEHLRKLCLAWGVLPANIVKAPVGADIAGFRPDLSGDEVRQKMGIRGPVVLYLGQLHSAQYAHLFLEAARQVAARVPQVTFLIVGEGARRRELEDLNARLEPAPVIFTGYVEHKDIPKYAAAADVCVASFEDNDVTRCKSPLKIVEYMAAGKPVVASDVGEVRWMLDVAGVLVPPGDVQGLAEGIVALLEDAPRRARLGALARRRAEEIFNWGRTAQGIAAVYGVREKGATA